MSPKPKKKKPPEMTTIAISVENQEELDGMRHGRESFDDILSRLINNQFDVFIEFLLIDNELPSLHTAAFQLGTDTDSVFYFDGLHQPRPSSLKEINKFMKEPKPNLNMIITREEAELLMRTWNFSYPKLDKEDQPKVTKLDDRLRNFLGIEE